ncbi:hypothetical protein LTR37_020178 [Vermiconidia calcicola]|uniref:Uncharacterized protein n=1 Tax=Vermiconidia calcicola TaxID=1690605 RepID=A0ACC3ME03_9PEZI|nr:hypothetical protein LTR37_020178 [Vermiconidia calcicola]
MPTEDPETFRVFQYWLYNRQFHSDKAEEVENMSFSTIINLWIFGDAHEIPLLQNAALNVLREKIVQAWVVPTYEIRKIYDNTLPESLLRKFMVEITAYIGYARSLLAPGTEDNWIHEALCDLLEALWVPQPHPLHQGGFTAVGSVQVPCTRGGCSVQAHKDFLRGTKMAPPSTPDKDPTVGMFDEIVDVKVGTGDKQRSLMLHEGLIRYHSGYFDAALSDFFSSTRPGAIEATVQLPEEDVKTFERFVLWLYTRKYQPMPKLPTSIPFAAFGCSASAVRSRCCAIPW